jgi:hypothetical protein
MILYSLVGIQVFTLRKKLNFARSYHIPLSSIVSAEVNTDTTSPDTQLTDEMSTHTKSEHTVELQISPVVSTSDARIQTQLRKHPTGISFRQYILMPLIFFLFLLSTWTAPTINRISAFVGDESSFSLLVAVVATGSLRGFWNGVVFITIGIKGRNRNRRF